MRPRAAPRPGDTLPWPGEDGLGHVGSVEHRPANSIRKPGGSFRRRDPGPSFGPTFREPGTEGLELFPMNSAETTSEISGASARRGRAGSQSAR